MKLHPDPAFLQATRNLIALRRSPAASRPGNLLARAKHLTTVTLGAFILVCFPLGIASAADRGPRLFIWSYLLFIGFGLVGSSVDQQLFRHPYLFPFALYPADTASVFRRQLLRAVRTTLILSVIAGSTLGFFAWKLGPASPLRAALAGLLVAATYAGLALAYATAQYRWPVLRLPVKAAAPLGLLLLIALKWSPRFQAVVGDSMDQHAEVFSSLLPTGWLILVWSTAAGLEPARLLVALPPLLVALAYLPAGIRHLAGHYRFRDAVLLEALGQLPEDADEDFAEALAEFQTQPPSRGRTAILDDVHAGLFLKPALPSPPGWIERLVWRSWSPREQTIAEFLRPSWPQWSTRLAVSLAILAASTVTLAVLRRFWPDWSQFSLIGFGIGLLLILPFSAGFTLQTLDSPGTGMSLSPLRVAPIRFRELLRLQFKSALVRSLVLAPFLAATGLACAWIVQEPPWTLALVGAQLALFPAATRPLLTLHRALATPVVRHRGVRSITAAAGVALVIVVNLAGLLVSVVPGLGFAVLPVLLGLNYASTLGAWRAIAGGPSDAITPDSPGSAGSVDWD